MFPLGRSDSGNNNNTAPNLNHNARRSAFMPTGLMLSPSPLVDANDVRSRWNMCIWSVMQSLPMMNRSMILKDLESSDKVMKKEPDETPPSSVDASPLQVNIPNLPPPQPTSSRLSTVTSSSAASPYGSPLGASLLSSTPSSLVNPFSINGDLSNIDFAVAIANAHKTQAAAAAIAASTALGPQQNGLIAGPSSGMQSSSQQSQQQQQSNAMNSSASSSGSSGGPSSSLIIPNQLGDGPKPLVGIDPTQFSADSPNFGSFSDWQSPLLSGYDNSTTPSPTMQSGPNMRIGAGGPMGHGGEDETNRKRQVRLLKNREAAKECRRKKKEYVKCLENRVSVLENQNKALIEELKTLKELYCRKEKNDM